MADEYSCSFCTKLGIPLPHNHTVRNYYNVDQAIICPNLLNTECSYCKKKGHTKNYCFHLKKKNNNTLSNNDTTIYGNNKRKNDSINQTYYNKCPKL